MEDMLYWKVYWKEIFAVACEQIEENRRDRTENADIAAA